MSILDNEGHDPRGLGNVQSRTEVADLRAEIARLREWMNEAINELCDPCDAEDFDNSVEKALRETMKNAIGKLRAGLSEQLTPEPKP